MGGREDEWLTGWMGRWDDGWVVGKEEKVVGCAEGVHV